MYKFPPVYKYPIRRPSSAAICFDHPVELGKETYVTLSFVNRGGVEKGAIYQCLGCMEYGHDWYTPLVLNEEHFLEVTKEHALDHQYIGEWGYYKWRR